MHGRTTHIQTHKLPANTTLFNSVKNTDLHFDTHHQEEKTRRTAYQKCNQILTVFSSNLFLRNDHLTGSGVIRVRYRVIQNAYGANDLEYHMKLTKHQSVKIREMTVHIFKEFITATARA